MSTFQNRQSFFKKFFLGKIVQIKRMPNFKMLTLVKILQRFFIYNLVFSKRTKFIRLRQSLNRQQYQNNNHQKQQFPHNSPHFQRSKSIQRVTYINTKFNGPNKIEKVEGL